MSERETDRAMDRLSQLTQRVIEFARRLKPDRVSLARRRDDSADLPPALPAVSTGDQRT